MRRRQASLDHMDGRWRMEVRVEGNCGPMVKNVDEVLRQVQQQLQDRQGQWVAQLRDHPAKFADLEARIHQTFQGLADQVVAGVLAQVTAADDFAQDAKKK
jgi:predicted ArsR family transcriptional regulator